MDCLMRPPVAHEGAQMAQECSGILVNPREYWLWTQTSANRRDPFHAPLQPPTTPTGPPSLI